MENKVGEVNELTGQGFGRVIFVDTKITKNYDRSEYVERVTLSQEGIIQEAADQWKQER